MPTNTMPTRMALMLASCVSTYAFVMPTRVRHTIVTARAPPVAPAVMQDQQFDLSNEQFDLLALRTFRRDTILQYDATNQSEPLRIALCFFGVLFSLCIPSLFPGEDQLSTNVAALLGTGISGTLFQRNRSARSSRMGKIDLEYKMGDLRAIYRGVRTNKLLELRGKRRVVALVGPKQIIDERVREARVYRRRLSDADAVVVPVYTDGAGAGGTAAVASEAESRWLWAAAEPAAWLSYFELLLKERSPCPVKRK